MIQLCRANEEIKSLKDLLNIHEQTSFGNSWDKTAGSGEDVMGGTCTKLRRCVYIYVHDPHTKKEIVYKAPHVNHYNEDDNPINL